MSDPSARRRETAIARLKVLLPALFALGLLFYAAITVYPLAGMAATPPNPLGGARQLLVWLAVALSIGGLFALFGALIVGISGGAEEETPDASRPST